MNSWNFWFSVLIVLLFLSITGRFQALRDVWAPDMTGTVQLQATGSLPPTTSGSGGLPDGTIGGNGNHGTTPINGETPPVIIRPGDNGGFQILPDPDFWKHLFGG